MRALRHRTDHGQLSVLILGFVVLAMVLIAGGVDVTAAQLARIRLVDAVDAAAPNDADALRHGPPLARFSDAQQARNAELKRFLFRELYRHPRVADMTARARTAVAELFDAYRVAPQEMPADYAGATDAPRAVADYIAGMTDRYALREHHRLTGRRLFDA